MYVSMVGMLVRRVLSEMLVIFKKGKLKMLKEIKDRNVVDGSDVGGMTNISLQ